MSKSSKMTQMVMVNSGGPGGSRPTYPCHKNGLNRLNRSSHRGRQSRKPFEHELTAGGGRCAANYCADGAAIEPAQPQPVVPQRCALINQTCGRLRKIGSGTCGYGQSHRLLQPPVGVIHVLYARAFCTRSFVRPRLHHDFNFSARCLTTCLFKCLQPSNACSHLFLAVC